jgi:hypothetical protein
MQRPGFLWTQYQRLIDFRPAPKDSARCATTNSRLCRPPTPTAQPRPEPTRNSEPKLPFASESKRRRELLRFAKVWAPYGGAPHEEIFVAYGLRPDQFYAQLAVLLLDATDEELTLLQAQLIREQCVEHLGRNAVETIESRRRLEGMQTRLRFSPPAGGE